MKIRFVLPAILATCVFAVLPLTVKADFYSAATSSAPEAGPGDLAGDVTSMFAVNTENARNLADVYGNCVENPQQGNWQGDPRQHQRQPVDYDYDSPQARSSATPTNTFVNFPPNGGDQGGRNRNPKDRDREREKNPPDEEDTGTTNTPVTPEPGTMILLGLGAAGLVPLSFRRRKTN